MHVCSSAPGMYMYASTLTHAHWVLWLCYYRLLTWKTSSTLSTDTPMNLPAISNVPTPVDVISKTTFLNLCVCVCSVYVCVCVCKHPAVSQQRTNNVNTKAHYTQWQHIMCSYQRQQQSLSYVPPPTGHCTLRRSFNSRLHLCIRWNLHVGFISWNREKTGSTKFRSLTFRESIGASFSD